jgi:predicted tellurium resistance membrane protein TerC
VALGISQCLISLLLSVIYFIGAKLVENDSVKIVNLFTAIYAIMFSGVQAGCNIGFIGGLAGAGLSTAQYFALVEPSDR